MIRIGTRPSLRRALLSLTLAVLAASRVAEGQQAAPATDRITGNWQGALHAGPSTLRLGLAITRTPQGGLDAELTSIDQGNLKLPAVITLSGDSILVDAAGIGVRYAATVTSGGDSLRGIFHQGGANLPLDMARVSAITIGTPPPRPQTPVAPFPYRAEIVSIPSVTGVSLAGTLTVPEGAGPFPAVVFVTGSGPQDRDETLLGHKPFLVIADHLARHGIASIRYDDRGTAHSTGSFARATSVDFADDAGAAVRFARSRPEVRANQVGIIGHSEGGLIGPMVAARSTDVAFVVMMAGPGIRGDSILLLQEQLIMEVNGMPHEVAMRGVANNARLFAAIEGATDSADADRRARTLLHALVDTLPAAQRIGLTRVFESTLGSLNTPWMRYFLTFDPQTVLRHVTVPVLALNGTLDLQVPARENLPAIDAALRAAGNRDYRTVAMPGLNHLFQAATTGNPSEYERITQTIAPAALELMTSWITAHTPPASRAH